LAADQCHRYRVYRTLTNGLPDSTLATANPSVIDLKLWGLAL
jgi:hypothetical protein